MKKTKAPTCLHLFSKPMDPQTLEDLSDVWICRWCGKSWDEAMKARQR